MADGQNLDGGGSLQHPIDHAVVPDDQLPKAAGGKFQHGSPGFRELLEPGGFGFDCGGELPRSRKVVGLNVSNKAVRSPAYEACVRSISFAAEASCSALRAALANASALRRPRIGAVRAMNLRVRFSRCATRLDAGWPESDSA